MNTHPDSALETEMVPEVDPSSLSPDMVAPEQASARDVVPDTPPDPLAILPPEQATKALPPTLAKHIEAMLTQADAQGYLRGRNEAIEATQHFAQRPDEPPVEAAFPRYTRRSIWD